MQYYSINPLQNFSQTQQNIIRKMQYSKENTIQHYIKSESNGFNRYPTSIRGVPELTVER